MTLQMVVRKGNRASCFSSRGPLKPSNDRLHGPSITQRKTREPTRGTGKQHEVSKQAMPQSIVTWRQQMGKGVSRLGIPMGRPQKIETIVPLFSHGFWLWKTVLFKRPENVLGKRVSVGSFGKPRRTQGCCPQSRFLYTWIDFGVPNANLQYFST